MLVTDFATAASPRSLPEIARADLTGLLEDFLIARLDPARDRFALHSFLPRLTWNRLDLAIKLFHAQTMGPAQPDFVRRLYDAHIHAFSLGEMSEPGNAAKNHLQAFHDQFAAMRDRFARDGFDPALSLVPLARDGSILNGAHRTACAMLHGVQITGIQTGLEPVRYDHDYFRSRGMSQAHLDAAVLKYIQLSPRSRIALLWPAAGKDEGAARDLLGPLVYRKAVRLSPDGAHNLLTQVYAGEDWLGDPDANHPGIKVKLAGCFKGRRPVRVLVFDPPGHLDLIALKQRIRARFGIGKHSIHITDTHGETLEVARLLLNDSSVAFLQQASPMAFRDTQSLAQGFRDYLARHNTAPDSVLVDSGFVLAAYGLRPSRRVDFLGAPHLPALPGFRPSQAGHHPLALHDLMADPECHFHFWGLKFLSPGPLIQMKRQRNRGQDAQDVSLLRSLRPPRRGSEWLGRARLMQARMRNRAIRLLAAIGVKDRALRLRRRLGGQA